MAHNPNLRLFVQSQSGMHEVERSSRARVQIPGEYTGNAVIIGQHQVARGGNLIVKPVSHQQQRYYDPSIHGTWHPEGRQDQAPAAEAVVAEVVEELNLQGFMAKQSVATNDIFADIGYVIEDDSIVAEDEDGEEGPSNAELNAPNHSSVEELFGELIERGPKSFGISKEELAAFKLTRKQVKALYTEVTGRQPGSTTIPKMKARIRAGASESFADYTRVTAAIKKVVLEA